VWVHFYPLDLCQFNFKLPKFTFLLWFVKKFTNYYKIQKKIDSQLQIVFFKWPRGGIKNYKKVKRYYGKRLRLFKLKFPQTILFTSGSGENEFPKIPSVNVVDTSTNIKNCIYLINANHKLLKGMLFFVRLLVKDKIIIRRFKKILFRRIVYGLV